jgi:hypothetical protein
MTLTPSVAPVATTLQLDVEVMNQNSRELLGRKINPGYDGRMLQRLDSVSFFAYAPREGTAQMSLNLAWNLTLRANFTIPLVPIQSNLVARDTLWWVTVSASNGGLGSPTPGPVPTSGTCGEIRHVPGEGTSYVDYQAKCATLYHVDYTVPPTLASGLQIREGQAVWNYLDGTQSGGNDAACGEVRCLESVKLELIDVSGSVVGRTILPIP